ncbi:MAG: 6,7-dimethyl-8-ribityllumazine synthase [Verrucomicrobiota bacterium]|nr:6,7-dimethyl-8-ribityllumazine synthase [Limisphaera sp.]MDW8380860.1 6,7-dimethyl-8-ribityllumazine synthase [Verrucomicrobiota bacterium]
MLRKVRSSGIRVGARPFVIVASRYNARYVDSLVRAARKTLQDAGARVHVVRVPGAYEIPLAADLVARRASAAPASTDRVAAIVCLGVILRGETAHAAHIGEAVTWALMQIQLRHAIPVIHEVLLLENEAQAVKRCLHPQHNRGIEAAETALQMAKLVQKLHP